MPISFSGGGSFTIVTVGINLRGAYDAGTTYATGDAVRAADGHTYVATAAVAAGTAPPASPWALYSGPAGSGEQAVYQRSTTNTAPSTPVGDAPAGWTASPQGVDGTNRYEWVSIRSGHTGAWGVWSTPAVAYLAGDDLTGPEIVALLTALTGGARLSFLALQVPDGSIVRNMLAADSVAGDAIQADGIGAGKIATTAAPDILAALAITAQNLADMVIGADINGNIITFNQRDGSTFTVTVPTTGGSLGVDLIATWARASSPSGTVPPERLSAATLVSLLAGLAGAARLEYSAIRDGPPADATDDQTGPEIVALLSALTNTARLPMSAVQGEVPEAQIPAAIARDSEIANLVYGLAPSMNGIQYRLAGSGSTLRNLNLTEPVHDLVNGLLVEGTGITLTYDDAAGTLTITATGGGGGVSTHTRYMAATTGTAAVEADFTGGTSSTGTTITAPTWAGASPGAGDRYLWWAIPADQPDLTDIHPAGGVNWLASTPPAVISQANLTIASVAHKVWRTRNVVYQVNSGIRFTILP